MYLLGLAGRARNGKDTVAGIMKQVFANEGLYVEILDIGAEILSFCKANRYISEHSVRESLHRDDLETMQRVGIEQRESDPNFWLDRIFLNMLHSKKDVGIITNVRLKNEVEFTKKNGHVVFVERLNLDGSLYIATDRDPNHVTETSVTRRDADYILSTKTSQIEWLKYQAEALASFLGPQIKNFGFKREE